MADSKQQYLDSELARITNDLSIMSVTYDSKLLTAALLIKAGGMLRSLHAIGLLSTQEVNGMIGIAFADATTPLPEDQKPQIAPLDLSQQRHS